jgi:hypothetical protein
MFCPNCGSQNLAGTKFCTRCGTNLTAVSEALGDRPAQGQMDEDARKLVKDYYKGRRNVVTGILLLVGGLKLFLLLIAAGMKVEASGAFTLWLILWGFPQLAIGLSQMLNARNEMKAFGYDIPFRPAALRSGASERLGGPTSLIAEAQGGERGGGATTDPIAVPSVTEQTTRRLEERPPAAPAESQHN